MLGIGVGVGGKRIGEEYKTKPLSIKNLGIIFPLFPTSFTKKYSKFTLFRRAYGIAYGIPNDETHRAFCHPNFSPIFSP